MSYAALPTLRTPRLTLRPLRETDADAIVDGAGNYDVSKWLAVVPYPYARQDALDFIARITREERWVWGICDADGLQGVIGIEDELGYWLARPAWGRGYAFEAALAVCDHWFSESDAGDLKAGYFEGNIRSRTILGRLGFRETGRRMRNARALAQDMATTEMLLTRADWNARGLSNSATSHTPLS
ncbi:MAG: GNAT family N-acetyltransferase [Silicimonas sp.]|jgi:RimJ/RimL family protein N-acetyltransferase|nr:GNAT family N-acetyltransferase [Silicimonas sp.]